MKLFQIIILSCMSLLVSSCNKANQPTGSIIQPSLATPNQINSAEQLIKGQTTKNQVIAILGKPTAVKMLADGKEDWVYDFKGSGANAFKIIPQSEIAYSVGPQKREKILQVIFDNKGVVEVIALLDSIK